jgi:riboflavin kinase/FMN adenylyltransferase
LQLPTPQVCVEAHLLDFKGDLYDKELEVTFIRRLREEKQFSSLELLKEQIARDIAQVCARSWRAGRND